MNESIDVLTPGIKSKTKLNLLLTPVNFIAHRSYISFDIDANEFTLCLPSLSSSFSHDTSHKKALNNIQCSAFGCTLPCAHITLFTYTLPFS